jgi:c-di-GMP-binding flagellar brake protein YcgR
MRTPRHQKLMDRSDSSGGESTAIEHLSARSSTTLVDPPSWTTRAKPKGISRVPTHAVRPVKERRAYTRAKLSLPLYLKRIAGRREQKHVTLRTNNISSSGVLFLYPQRIEPGTPLEIEVSLVDRPFGRGTVKMRTEAHVVRTEPAPRHGWHALAVTFDEITFLREEPLPSRFRRQ